jgi:DNA-binding NarL/FixJ family response regulator
MYMRCIVVDDHSFISAGVTGLLKLDFPGCEVAAASTVREAINFINVHNDGVITMVFLDLVLPDESGIAVLKHIQKLNLDATFLCIVISSIEDQETISLCKKLGAKGYIGKAQDPTLLSHAIRIVLDGGAYFCDEETNKNKKYTQGDFLEKAMRLTNRERDVLDLVLAGYSNKKIADELALSYGTIKNRIHDLLKEFSVNTRLEIATMSRSSGYVPRTIPEITDNRQDQA